MELYLICMSGLHLLMDLNYLTLPDGRRIAYRELGCAHDTAKRSILLLHGLGSSRLAAMPGVDEQMLREFGVRLVAIDRPNYGRSDIHTSQSLESTALDMQSIIQILNLGSKVYLLGYSAGAAFCWAAARYIPDRIHSIALWAPVGNYWWKGITGKERKEMLSEMDTGTRIVLPYVRLMSTTMLTIYARYFLCNSPGPKWLEQCKSRFSAPDQQHLTNTASLGDLMMRDGMESMGSSKGNGIGKDLKMLFGSDWGFEPEDISRVYAGKIHIWQGDDDRMVPISMQRWVRNAIPNTVSLYELHGHGHLSWFCFNDDAHRQVLSTLFSDI